MKLFGGTEQAPKQVQTGLKRAEKRDWLGIVLQWGGWSEGSHTSGGLEFLLFELSVETKEEMSQAFLSAYPDVGQEGKREEWGLKTINKIWSKSHFYTLFNLAFTD